MTLQPGLVSVTFRKLDVEAVAQLAADCGLVGIEWGGDIHVPAGDVAAAGHARQVTADHGLSVAAYGSYYRAGHAGQKDVPTFEAVLDSAVALAAPVIRVWPGRQEADAGDAYAELVADDLLRVIDVARTADIRVACEWHEGTMTADASRGGWLLDNVPDLLSYWQPSNGRPHATRLAELDVVRPRLAHVHVFNWLEEPDGRDRRPLQDGRNDWQVFLQKASDAPRQDDLLERFAMLEFVRDDDIEQCRQDAAVLLDMLGKIT